MKTDSSSIVEVSLSLFRQKGYKRTSMADIGRATGLLKGSVYHHFSNKERILVQAVLHVARIFEDDVFALTERSGLTAKERLCVMVDAIEKYYIEHRTCALLLLWPDAVHESPDAQRAIRQFFQRWNCVMAALLRDRYGQEESMRLSAAALARIEGGVSWLQIMDDSRPLRDSCEAIRNLL